MGLFGHHNNATGTNQDQTALNTQANTGTALGGRGPAVGSNQPTTHAEADPLYNNERGVVSTIIIDLFQLLHSSANPRCLCRTKIIRPKAI